MTALIDLKPGDLVRIDLPNGETFRVEVCHLGDSGLFTKETHDHASGLYFPYCTLADSTLTRIDFPTLDSLDYDPILAGDKLEERLIQLFGAVRARIALDLMWTFGVGIAIDGCIINQTDICKHGHKSILLENQELYGPKFGG